MQRTNNIGNPNNKKKLLVCGDSHVKRLCKLLLNNSLKKSHAVLKNFDGANIKRLSHHILPYLHEDKSDSVILHIGTNDVQPNMDSTPEKLSDEIINLSQICKQSGVKNVYVSSILPKNDSRLSHFVSKVSNLLADKCKRYDVIFISNENIRTGCLAKDGIHLNDIGPFYLGSNFVDCVNYFDSVYRTVPLLSGSPSIIKNPQTLENGSSSLMQQIYIFSI